MVHPYLRRRNGIEPVNFPIKYAAQSSWKDLGNTPVSRAGYEAFHCRCGFHSRGSDGLRRALATFKRIGDIHQFQTRFIRGMLANGYEQKFAERCFKQIEGFADYGFPESHAASFALLVYVSSWLKCHHPAVFACALLNSQPMGFYTPAQIVRDLREHNIEVKPVDINNSDWDCSLEALSSGKLALRLGFRQVKGINQIDMKRLISAREVVLEILQTSGGGRGLSKVVLENLARADAFISVGLDRRQALWMVKGLDNSPLPLFRNMDNPCLEPEVTLPQVMLGEHVADDYRALTFSLRSHPLHLLRKELTEQGYQNNAKLTLAPNGERVRIAGLVTNRQRPESAKGVLFVTIEDEMGITNIIVWPKIFEIFRRPLLRAVLMGVTGEIQKEGQVIHVVSQRIEDLTPLLATIENNGKQDDMESIRLRSRDFH